MALNLFIPNVWSETLYRALDRELVAVRNCNREFEGDIRKCGDTVNICGIGDIAVFDYQKNSDIGAPQALDATRTQLTVDQSKAFHFQIDDIDRAQQNPKLMQHAMHQAASALANAADAYVFSLHNKIAESHTLKNEALTAENVMDLLLEAKERLMLANVHATEEVVLEVSPEIASLILKAKLTETHAEEALETGCIGRVLGFLVYVSNNVCKAEISGKTVHKCFARTRRAIAYAQQLNEMEAYRPEKRFADAIKGLLLFGAKIVYENELLLLDLTVA